MKHAGKAAEAGWRIIWLSLFALIALLVAGLLARTFGQLLLALGTGLVLVWVIFAGFVVSFFRDPEPRVPREAEVYIAPAHGKVDTIDEVEELEVMEGRCRRISIFLSVFDVHVQYAPVAGEIFYVRHRPGRFVNAMRAESAVQNENVLLGFRSRERGEERVGVRLIAGLIARRILPWVQLQDEVARGERISLIQFGSRVELYVPLSARVEVALGDRVRGGETILARN